MVLPGVPGRSDSLVASRAQRVFVFSHSPKARAQRERFFFWDGHILEAAAAAAVQLFFWRGGMGWRPP